jgi:hypothetical protein
MIESIHYANKRYAKSQEPRAKSQEPRAKSQEPRAKSQEYYNTAFIFVKGVTL